ncbi:hypothetical protein AAG906_015124 [Vitis piasezkii]
MSTGVEERIYLWTRKKRKVTDLLDLNAYPEDGILLGKEVNIVKANKVCEKQKENKLLLPLVANGKKSVATKSGGKGFLKIKASINGSSENTMGLWNSLILHPEGIENVYTHQWDAGGFCETPFCGRRLVVAKSIELPSNLGVFKVSRNLSILELLLDQVDIQKALSER